MQKIIISALAALSLAAIATPASAETQSVKVAYADLNLSSQAGMAALESRIHAAAKKICGKVEVRQVGDGAAHQRCMDETQASASVEIARVTGNRAVLALNSRR